MKKTTLFIFTIFISIITNGQIKSNPEKLLNSLGVKKVVVKYSHSTYTRGNDKEEIGHLFVIQEQDIINGYPSKIINNHNTNGILKDKTSIKYDLSHRETEIVSVNGSSINEYNTGIEDIQKFSYDSVGNIISYSREYGGNNSYSTYSYKYNEKKQVIEKISKVDGRELVTAYTYDKKGNVIKINDGTKNDKGKKIEYEYFDKTDKIKQKTINTIEHNWQYNEKGLLIVELEPGKSYYYKYNDQDQIIEYTESLQSGTSVMTVRFKYDSNKDLISEAILDGKLANGGYKYYTEKLKEYVYNDNKLIKGITVYQSRKLDDPKKLIFEKYVYEYAF